MCIRDRYMGVAYTSAGWAKAITGKGCTSLLEYMSSQYPLVMSTDASWSDAVDLKFSESSMYLVASICYSPHVAELQGFSIQFEIKGCDHEPISEADLNQLQGKTYSTPTPRDPQTPAPEQSSRFMFFNSAALVFFVLSLILFQVAVKRLFTRQFLFQFPILVGSIVARILMHTMVLLDSYVESEIVDAIVTILDVLSQYSFIFTSIITILGYLSESVGQAIITLTILSLIYFALGFTKRRALVLALRLLLVAGAGGAFGYGLRKSEQPKNVKLASLASVVAYVLGLLLVEMDLLGCTPHASVLVDRFYLLKSYQNCPSALHWIVEGDPLIQAIIMGVSLFIMGYLTRDR
eukprot:TRINITY_DN8017_c0_g3_i1.p1 TRINITY_DN8017_c0_g3~~TRINITY_DN8017_c0_g3_i1.p1  ORF type:complete len:350 (+),score=52.55 TRINITY_DN8017_c0_g3_i1:76-1125(+)